MRKLATGVVTLGVAMLVAWEGRSLLRMFFPEIFIGHGTTDQPPPPPPPRSVAPSGSAKPGAVAVAPGSAGSQEVSDALAELTADEVARDPLAALRRLARLTRDYAGSDAGKVAQARIDEIRGQFADQVAPGEASAAAEVARVISANVARLARLEHRSVAVDLRALEDRYGGLAAGAAAGAERARVQAEWEGLSPEEKATREAFASIPGTFADDGQRLDAAILAHQIARDHPDTRCGPQAARRCGEILAELASSLEAAAKADDASQRIALGVAKRLPKEFAWTGSGRRIAAVQKRLEKAFGG